MDGTEGSATKALYDEIVATRNDVTSAVQTDNTKKDADKKALGAETDNNKCDKNRQIADKINIAEWTQYIPIGHKKVSELFGRVYNLATIDVGGDDAIHISYNYPTSGDKTFKVDAGTVEYDTSIADTTGAKALIAKCAAMAAVAFYTLV